VLGGTAARLWPVLGGGRPAARLVPVEGTSQREFDVDRAVLSVPDDFDAPLPDDVADAFER
jgi:antitoxin (DNA-binding transcriptional repressor) of toxin-antitoxin stability system